MSSGNRIAPVLLLGAGIVLVAASVSLDLLGIGAPGFGSRQKLGLALGALLILAAAPTRRWLTRAASAAPTIGAIDCFMFAVWVGILTGIFEVAHLGIRHYSAGFVLRHSELLISMAPLSYTILFGTCGVALAALVAIVPRIVNGPVVVFALVLLAVYSQLSLHVLFGELAMALVCLGVAVQSARAATTHWQKLASFRRKTMPWCVGLLALLIFSVPVARSLNESRTLANLPPAAEGAPNVLLIVLDTMRADHLQSYGYQRDTSPNIEAIAREGLVFERFVSTSPWTLPSHGTLFTGRYSHELSANWTVALDDTYPTLAEVLSRNGYATAGFAGNLGYCSRAYGLARGFAHYMDYGFDPEVLAGTNPIGRKLFPRAKSTDLLRHDAATITSGFIDWLPSRGERPFFAFLNYYDAHALYRVPEPFREKYSGKYGKSSLDPKRWETRDPTDEFIQELMNGHDACIGYIDEHIGMLVDHLREQGLLDNTLLIVTGDHGEHFGERGLVAHGNSLYWAQLHVPLVIRFPRGGPGSGRVAEFVSMRDLPATILDVIGVKPEVEFPGVSLRPLWDANGAAAPFVGSPILSSVRRGIRTPEWEPIYKGDMKSEVVGGLLHIFNGDGTEEKYDPVTDPRNERDLTGK